MASQAAVDKHRVTAVLVSHNGAVWLPEVVAALTSQTRPIDLITAVDTGSQDASTKLLKSARIPFVSADVETGFGQAISLAVNKLPKAVENEWIWLIHDDCAPAPTALAELLAAVNDRPQVVMVGPKLLGWHDRTHLLEAGVSIAGNGARWTGLEPLEYDQGQHDGNHDVLAVSTAGALIRREVFEELGGLDPKLTLFRDDVDFGWRARAAGHSVMVATGAVAFHAQASANERRTVEVEGAFLHRPLLLDRRNAAYVLLSNSSWWILPWLVIQLLGTAIARAIGYLIAKLPGYAADEILAVGSLIVRPGLIIAARKVRKKQRFVSARVIAEFIPPRWSQIRLALEGVVDAVRAKLFPENNQVSTTSVLDTNDDEDLLTPVNSNHWFGVFKRPEVIGFVLITLISLLNSRNRFGALVGGALPISTAGATDLWRTYFESWHQVGMGSTVATPTWVAITATASLFFLGKVQFLITIFFLVAPILMMFSASKLLKRLTGNTWISMPAAFLYAMSPVAIAAVSTGHIATVLFMILAPLVALLLSDIENIESFTWRKIAGVSLLLALLYGFSLMIFVIGLAAGIISTLSDYGKHAQEANAALYSLRFQKRVALIFVPFILNIPYSLETFTHPSRLLVEPGLLIPGGGPIHALLGNPGGANSLPIWLVSPILLVLIVSLFSSTHARQIAEYGVRALVLAVVVSALSISTHGNEASSKVWPGPVLVLVTLAAVAAGTVLLDRLRETLVLSHIHYRHVLSALLLFTTFIYSVLAIGWTVTKGADSLVQANQETVMPAFLSVEKDVKILVLREVGSKNDKKIQYYLSRGKDISLGEPDVAPTQTVAIAEAARGLIDGSGVTSSSTLSDFGVKYLYVKAPFKKEIIRSIDGIGGFSRTSATSLGVVWKVTAPASRLMFVGADGVRKELEAGEVGARTFVPSAGTLILTETYNRSWQVLENGYRLDRNKSEQGLPTFTVTEPGEISLIHDGTIRRGWLSLQLILLVIVLVMALPAGRRKSEISERELA
ncbi:MAG: glycosyltransferase family 2 protein [Actinomycetales bacterium]|nr:glycosyltransferase family 2 protein [Actinomycetales bacterium]